MRYFRFLVTGLLLAVNILLWNVERVFLHTPPRRPLPPDHSSDISRTADDIARGLLFNQDILSEEQKLKLKPLAQEGYELRKALEEENHKYMLKQEELLKQAAELLEER